MLMIAHTCAGKAFFMQCQYQKIAGALYSRIKVSILENHGRLLDIEKVRWCQRHWQSAEGGLEPQTPLGRPQCKSVMVALITNPCTAAATRPCRH